ncbi:FAD-dependent oxidoreductase [Nocardia sp. NPDC059177]|uniref:hydroxysqualene dehydroxylase n=1 Tax=Nocardia sp. NPDC059177 TaxID=3346759 RepID=UPI0036A2E4FD
MGINWRAAGRGFTRTAPASGLVGGSTLPPTRRGPAAPGSPTVAVFGAGPAGLTAAHELAERGCTVTVYERRTAPGGKCRTVSSNRIFGFHHNLPDTLRRIPVRGNRHGVHDNLIQVDATTIASTERGNHTVPQPFPLSSRRTPMTPRQFADSTVPVFETLFRLPPHEALFAAERLAVYVSSCDERKLGQWERMSWSDFAGLPHCSADYHRFLDDGFLRSLIATTSAGCSAHSIGLTGEDYIWSLLNLDDNGGGHDRVFDGPGSEAFIDPWITHLRSLGVTIVLGARLTGFETDGAHISAATVTDNTGARHTVRADHYLSAIPLDKVPAVLSPDILAADPRLAAIAELHSAWLVGIQFFLRRRVAPARGQVAYLDAPWRLTSISAGHLRHRPLRRHRDGSVADVLSVTIAEWDAPGLVTGKTARQCTPGELAAETWAQLRAHADPADGEPLTGDLVHSWLVDPSPTGAGTREIAYDDALFVPQPGSLADRPHAGTGLDNLFLAGDWIRTGTNIPCLEGANESGRLAANAILRASGSAAGAVPITPRFRMPLWEPLKLADSALYQAGLPNTFDLIDRRYPVR